MWTRLRRFLFGGAELTVVMECTYNGEPVSAEDYAKIVKPAMDDMKKSMDEMLARAYGQGKRP